MENLLKKVSKFLGYCILFSISIPALILLLSFPVIGQMLTFSFIHSYLEDRDWNSVEILFPGLIGIMFSVLLMSLIFNFLWR